MVVNMLESIYRGTTQWQAVLTASPSLPSRLAQNVLHHGKHRSRQPPRCCIAAFPPQSIMGTFRTLKQHEAPETSWSVLPTPHYSRFTLEALLRLAQQELQCCAGCTCSWRTTYFCPSGVSMPSPAHLKYSTCSTRLMPLGRCLRCISARAMTVQGMLRAAWRVHAVRCPLEVQHMQHKVDVQATIDASERTQSMTNGDPFACTSHRSQANVCHKTQGKRCQLEIRSPSSAAAQLVVVIVLSSHTCRFSDGVPSTFFPPCRRRRCGGMAFAFPVSDCDSTYEPAAFLLSSCCSHPHLVVDGHARSFVGVALWRPPPRMA